MSLREICLQENKKLSTSNLVVLTWGNVSIRYEDNVYIKPSGVSYDHMIADNIAVVSLSTGKHISGQKPSVDLKTHLELYKNFSEIESVAHTHSKFCTSFAQSQIPIKCLGTTHADYFYGTIPVTKQLTSKQIEGDYEGNTGAKIIELFNKLELSYKEMPGVLVRNHGVFTWGLSFSDAFKHAFVMEQIAEMAYHSHVLSDKEPSKLPQYILDKHYERKHGKSAYYGQR